MTYSPPLPYEVDEAAREAGPQVFQAVVDAAVDLLKGGSSDWPVDTGRSKRAWRRIGSGLSSEVHNPVRYAAAVEGKNGYPARNTLDNNSSYLMSIVEEQVPARSTEQLQLEHVRTIRRAAATRQVLEGQVGLRSLYVEALAANHGRVRIPGSIRRLDRRIRRRAARG